MDIRPYSKNAKKHPKKQIEQVAKSIEEFGMNQQIVVDNDGVIIVGHGRFAALQMLGWDVKPEWIKVVDLTEQQAKAYRLADNKLNESDWDMELVIEELKELEMRLLEMTGFEADLIIDVDSKDDVVPGLPDEPRSKLGDLYELNGHRLLCGDSTSVEALEKLMDGHKADAVFTDPPYNVNYSGTGKKTSNTILNDKMSDEQFSTFLLGTFERMKENIKATAGCYVFHSHKTMTDFDMALNHVGFIIDTQLIWNKPSAGLGMNDYRTKHEPFYYCYLNKKKSFYGDRRGTTVWKIPADDLKALDWLRKQTESIEGGQSTVWSMKRSNVNDYVHPTQKPVELVVKAITNSTKEDDIVLDQFLGSGSTVIAAEKSSRLCYGLELDPKYCDVIVQRWVDFTEGGEVVKNKKKIKWPKS